MIDIEQTLQTIKTIISATISAELATISIEKADGLSLPVPFGYSINELGVIDNFPFIQIIPDTSDTILPMVDADELDHKIIIIAHVIGTEGVAEMCSKRAYRYARALTKIILNNRTLGGNATHWYKTQVNYQPMMVRDNVYKQEVWIHTTLKNFEDGAGSATIYPITTPIDTLSVASSAGTTALVDYNQIMIVTGVTTHTLTLPVCTSSRKIIIKNRSTGNVTVTPNGTDTIDGISASIILAGGTSVTLNGFASDWVLL